MDVLETFPFFPRENSKLVPPDSDVAQLDFFSEPLENRSFRNASNKSKEF